MNIMEVRKTNIVELSYGDTIEIQCSLISLINAKIKMLKESPNEFKQSIDWHLKRIEKLIVIANKVGLEFGLNTVDQEYDFIELKKSLELNRNANE